MTALIIAQQGDSNDYYPTSYEYPDGNMLLNDIYISDYTYESNNNNNVSSINTSIENLEGDWGFKLIDGQENEIDVKAHLITEEYKTQVYPDYLNDDTSPYYVETYKRIKKKYFINQGFTEVEAEEIARRYAEELNIEDDLTDIKVTDSHTYVNYFKIVFTMKQEYTNYNIDDVYVPVELLEDNPDSYEFTTIFQDGNEQFEFKGLFHDEFRKITTISVTRITSVEANREREANTSDEVYTSLDGDKEGKLISYNITISEQFIENREVFFNILPIDNKGNIMVKEDVGIEAYYYYEETKIEMEFEFVEEEETTPKEELDWAFFILSDSSGSMGTNDPEMKRRIAARTFIQKMKMLSPDSLFAIGDFGPTNTKGFNVTRLLQEFTNNYSLLTDAIEKFVANGGTPLYDSLSEVLDYIKEFSGFLDKEYKYAILILSDGEPNDELLKEEVYNKSLAYGIPINSVYMTHGGERGKQVMDDLSQQTGGIPYTVDKSQNLETAFENIAFGNEGASIQCKIIFPDDQLPPSGTIVEVTLEMTMDDGISTIYRTLKVQIP